jgi:hypothetical protein
LRLFSPPPNAFGGGISNPISDQSQTNLRKEFTVKSIVARYVLLLALLAACISNVYAQTFSEDAAAFRDGTAPKFSTKGHPKSKGAVFTIKYPPSWEAKEGDRPNVVQKFVGKANGGIATAMIITKSIPSNVRFTQADVRAAVSPEGLKDFLPEGAKLLKVKTTKIEGESAGLIEYSMRMERAGAEADFQYLTLIFFQGRTMVSMQFSIGALSSDSGDLPSRFEEFRPIFNLMMNNIVFDDKWK